MLALTSAAYLSSSPQRLDFTVSSPPDDIFTWKMLGGGGRALNGEGHLQRSFDASPCFLLLKGLLLFKRARLEPWVCVCVVRFPFLWLVAVLWNPWNTSITKITMPCVLSG